MAFSSVLKLKAMPSQINMQDLTNQEEDRSFLKTALAWRGSVTPKILPRVLCAGIYSGFLAYVCQFLPLASMSVAPFEYTGVVLGLLLVARTNAGLDRWWEARKIWGSIVNQSRNLAIVCSQYGGEKDADKSELLKWIALWPYAMKAHLREQKELERGDELVGSRQADSIKSSSHMPTFIGARIAQKLRKMRQNGLDDFSFLEAEKQRALLIDAIGACERIKSTPIPFVLAIKTRRFILLFLGLLPLAAAPQVGWLTPFIMMLTAYPLFCLDQIGIELQNPFSEKNLSHLPLTKICQTIENNISQISYMPGVDDAYTSSEPLVTNLSKTGPEVHLS